MKGDWTPRSTSTQAIVLLWASTKRHFRRWSYSVEKLCHSVEQQSPSVEQQSPSVEKWSRSVEKFCRSVEQQSLTLAVSAPTSAGAGTHGLLNLWSSLLTKRRFRKCCNSVGVLSLTLLSLPSAYSEENSTNARNPSCPRSQTNEAVANPTTDQLNPPASGIDSNTKSLAQDLYSVDSAYAQKIFDKIDATIDKEFFDAKAATESWPSIATHHRKKILEATNLKQLSDGINAALSELKVSHTQFVTINDETFYFLKNLFASFMKNEKNPIGEYLGIGLGGPGFRDNQVRYVLDGGPAATAGISRGDILKALDGTSIRGLLSFKGTAGTTVRLQILRNAQTIDVAIKPTKTDYYEAYLEASRKSAKVFSTPAGPVGYLRLWCGGKSGEVLDEVMSERMMGTKAMILDLRDGFGGNSLEDLDMFYRPPAGYPVFKTYGRKGRKSISRLTYTKPLVVLINGGSRSGKELLAYSLKNSKRGILVGENTAGAVLAGRLFALDDRCALYLAVLDGTVNGVRLEGVGVPPDIKCPYPADSITDVQLEAALKAAQAAIKQAGVNTSSRMHTRSSRPR